MARVAAETGRRNTPAAVSAILSLVLRVLAAGLHEKARPAVDTCVLNIVVYIVAAGDFHLECQRQGVPACPQTLMKLSRHKPLVSASSVASAVKGLLDKDFITNDRGEYAVYDKFFALWLKGKGLLRRTSI